MSCRSDPAPASSGHRADQRCDDPVHPCPLHCPPLEIEVNDTPATDDDYVQIKCTFPPGRHRVPCRIRVRNPGAESPTVVLTNPDGRLRFPGDADTTRTLSVPANGSWASFEISGETGSNALDDAVIEAHCQTPTGAVLATKTVTVFWFDQAQIAVTPGGNYTLAGGRYSARGGNGVDYSAQARIRPAGVSCTAPQVTNLRIGMIQNLTPPYTKTKTWDSPTIAWTGGGAGTTVTVPSSLSYIVSVPVVTNDSETSVAPLYDQPGKTGTLDADSLKPPGGCPNSGPATSSDTPSTPFPATFAVPARSASGAAVGTVTYGRRVKVVLNQGFKIWTVAFDTASNELCALRERTWTLHVDSSAVGAQQAAAGADSAPRSAPVTAPPFGNDRTNDPANQSTVPEGAATTTFVHP